MMNSRKFYTGFTMIELIVAITILGILAVASFGFLQTITQLNQRADMRRIRQRQADQAVVTIADKLRPASMILDQNGAATEATAADPATSLEITFDPISTGPKLRWQDDRNALTEIAEVYVDTNNNLILEYTAGARNGKKHILAKDVAEFRVTLGHNAGNDPSNPDPVAMVPALPSQWGRLPSRYVKYRLTLGTDPLPVVAMPTSVSLRNAS